MMFFLASSTIFSSSRPIFLLLLTPNYVQTQQIYLQVSFDREIKYYQKFFYDIAAVIALYYTSV